jgi:tRNA uridine 5-carbamoylmethylation protein Kti12
MTNQYLIILSGPPSVGKNTIAAKICTKHSGITAEIDLDRVKSNIYNSPYTDFYFDLASEIGQSMVRIYLKNNINVVIHKAFCSYKFVNPFIEIANELNVKCFYYKLTAPLDVLLERNAHRNPPSRDEDLKRVYYFDKECEHSEGIIIDTEKEGIEGAFKTVLSEIDLNR